MHRWAAELAEEMEQRAAMGTQDQASGGFINTVSEAFQQIPTFPTRAVAHGMDWLSTVHPH